MSTDIINTDANPNLAIFSREGFELVQRMAKAFSSSSLVPKHYQGQNGISNCIIALNMAARIGSDPLMTMQNLYVVHGTPSWSAQFLIATFNTCGKFSAIRYEWSGTEGDDDWGCRAIATERESGEVLRGSLVTIKLAKDEGWHGKTGSKWKTMPAQMMMYRAAAWFVRAYAPEIAMGLHTVEELQDCGPLEKSNGAKVQAISLEDLAGTDNSPDDADAPKDGQLFTQDDKEEYQKQGM